MADCFHIIGVDDANEIIHVDVQVHEDVFAVHFKEC